MRLDLKNQVMKNHKMRQPRSLYLQLGIQEVPSAIVELGSWVERASLNGVSLRSGSRQPKEWEYLVCNGNLVNKTPLISGNQSGTTSLRPACLGSAGPSMAFHLAKYALLTISTYLLWDSFFVAVSRRR